jgi:hypothetical protein
MKKIFILSVLSAIIIAISCSKKMTPSKTTATTMPPKPTVTYAANIKYDEPD